MYRDQLIRSGKKGKRVTSVLTSEYPKINIWFGGADNKKGRIGLQCDDIYVWPDRKRKDSHDVRKWLGQHNQKAFAESKRADKAGPSANFPSFNLTRLKPLRTDPKSNPLRIQLFSNKKKKAHQSLLLISSVIQLDNDWPFIRWHEKGKVEKDAYSWKLKGWNLYWRT